MHYLFEKMDFCKFKLFVKILPCALSCSQILRLEQVPTMKFLIRRCGKINNCTFNLFSKGESQRRNLVNAHRDIVPDIFQS